MSIYCLISLGAILLISNSIKILVLSWKSKYLINLICYSAFNFIKQQMTCLFLNI